MTLRRLWWTYATRSLSRAGQRTVLGVFCISVGVMAVVALRLAGTMVGDSLTANVRGVLGGDVSVQALTAPLTAADVARIAQLQAQGLVSGIAPLGTDRGTLRITGGKIAGLLVDVVDDPEHFPLVEDASSVVRPAGARLGELIAPRGTIVVSQFVADQLRVDVGVTLHLNLTRGGGEDVRLVGIVANRLTAGGATLGYISRETYAAMTTAPERYGVVDLTTPSAAKADEAAKILRSWFPTATVQTVQDVLDADRTIADDTTRFLTIVGLLALLIGGVGVANTIQVSLRRRALEIAVLKTSGYRRRDLVALFGLEAGLLGLAGGVLGALAGVGVSAVVRVFVERLFRIAIAFHVDVGIVASGVVVGVATSLIFGILPIVRAAAVRPLAVLRGDDVAVPPASRAQTVALYVLLVILFSALSLGLIGSLLWTVVAVVATLVTIAVLGALFAALVGLVSRLPVPDRPRLGFLGLVTVAAAGCTLLVWRGPRAVGTALLVAALFGYVVAVLPKRGRTALRLALRSMGRARGRTAATLVALFVGVFTIGLVVVLGQDIGAKVDESLTALSGFNVFAIASGNEAERLVDVTTHLPGLESRNVTHDVSVEPTRLRGIPIGQLLARQRRPGPFGEAQFRLAGLTGVEGYDLASGRGPDVLVVSGRPLTAGDSGSDAVLLNSELQRAPLHVRLGDTIEVTDPDTGRTATLRVVGFYAPVRASGSGLRIALVFQPILADRGIVDALGGTTVQTVVALRLDPARKAVALGEVEKAVPRATVLDIGDYATLVTDLLGNLVTFFVVIASLALFAAVVIIGNTVALAMVERRREIGILKAVGYSAQAVLAQVVVENGIVGALGAVSGMAAVTAAAFLLGHFLLGIDLEVATPLVVVVVLGITTIVALTTTVVAWRPVRVRPLEVLRYE